MTTTTNWQSIRHEILRKLDIRAEYIELGVEVVGKTPNHKGWIDCRSYGKQDRNPSAGINVSGEEGWHGRYKEFTGSGRSMLIFDFSVDIGKFPSFIDSIKHYAEKAGVPLPKGRRPEGPESKLDFRKWNDPIVKNWCRIKGGMSSQAVSISGAQMAQYPKKTGQFTVIAFPFYGESGIDGDPIGWAAYSVTGQPLPLPQGDGMPPKMLKVMTMSGSSSGLIGRHGLSILAKAELVWKVEGITDMVAVQTAILRHSEPCKSCGGSASGCNACYKGKVFPYVNTHAVITTAGGTMEFPKQSYLNCFAGKKAYVLHDADKDGRLGGERWHSEVSKVASECRHIGLPYELVESHGPDVRDWLKEGHNYADLLKLAENPLAMSVKGEPPKQVIATESTPDGSVEKVEVVMLPKTTTPDETSIPRSKADDATTLMNERRMCEILQIQVVGEDDSMGIEVFSLKHGKSTTIRKISALTFEELLQICGEHVRAHINMNPHQEQPGMFRMSTVKQGIASIAGYQRASMESKLGLGCWRALDSSKQPRDAVVVVGGHEGFEWDFKTEQTKRLRQPIWGGMILDFKNEDTWYDFDLLSGYLKDSVDPAWSLKVVEDSIKLFSNWNWKYPKYTPTVVTGLVLASWVQTLWYWRPMVALTGPSHAGKTTLFESLEHIFGPLAMRSAKSSEAGIRQGIGNDACIPLMDEFESDSHRQKILDLLRTSSKGDKTFRGTTGGSGQTFGLRHICWVAAIEVGLKREPDKNRFIQLELKKHKKDDHGKMDWMPQQHELADMGMKLLAIAIRNVNKALKISDALRSHKQDGVHGRIIESYSVPIAMVATVSGDTEDIARGMMKTVLDEIDFDGVTSADEEELMDAILSSTVDLGSQGRPSVGQCLDATNAVMMRDSRQGLEKSGVSTVDCPVRDSTGTHVRKHLFIVPGVVCRFLLRDTPWRDQSIDQILKRIPGATTARHRVNGHAAMGIRIPWDVVTDMFLGDKDTPNDGTIRTKTIQIRADFD